MKAMSFLRGLLALIGIVLFFTIGGAAFVTTMRLGMTPSPSPALASPSPRTVQAPAPVPPPSQPHVVCEGCDRKPTVEVRSTPAALSSGEVATSFRYTPEPYTVLGGAAKYPHDVVREILE